jgi:hypothetical protein
MDSQRQRFNSPGGNDETGGPAGDDTLRQRREELSALYQAANDLIERSLSNDAETLLDRTRQHGGE